MPNAPTNVDHASALDLTAPLPLTTSQKLIYAGQQLQPDDPLYNMVMLFNIKGSVKHQLFAQAFQTLVDNCDALRTVFVVRAGVDPSEPELIRQRVFERVDASLDFIDLSNKDNPEDSLNLWITKHKQKIFDIHHCLFESALFKLSEKHYCWYLNQHHLLTDAWSMGVLFERLQHFYSLAQQNSLDQAKPLPAFTDYLTSEIKAQQSKHFINAEQYWQSQLKSNFQASRFYHPTAPTRSARTNRVPCEFGALRSEKLKHLAKLPEFAAFSTDLSLMQLFSTLLFAYLFRISGNTQITIGTPTHSRTSQALKETAGLLINIFPLKLEIDSQDSFTSLYQKVAAANQRLLIHAVPGSTQVEHNRLFDVVLNYIPTAFADFAGMATDAQWLHADYGDHNHLLRLQVHNFQRDSAFTLYFDVNEQTFARHETRYLCEHFLALTDAFLQDPDEKLTTSALVKANSPMPYQQAVGKLNNSQQWQAVTHSIEATALRKASDTALISGTNSMSFATLLAHSNSLLEQLALRGIGKGDVVAVMMERSFEAVVSILSILRRGAVFLPIDQDYPAERIHFMLKNANAALILTDNAAEQPPKSYSCKSMEVNLAQFPHHAAKADIVVGENDPAYIIYTSGSSGQPKGVVVSHQNLSHYVGWAASYYQPDQPLCFALFSSLSFDLTITSLFVPLFSGGKLVIYPESDNPADITIRTVITDNRVDIIKLTPAHLSLIQSMDFSTSRLRALIVGGDDFKTELARTLSTYFADTLCIYNEYGPTEATVACSVHKYQLDLDTAQSVPIGKPISGSEIFIYDSQFNLVPQGVKGEIFVAGHGLAKGYLNQPELTSSRFIVDPNQGQRRLYCTGDLGRFNRRGEIEYLGRNDNQVKIYGVRIETAEIEAALQSHPLISDAAVEVTSSSSITQQTRDTEYCVKCGLAANHPSAQLNQQKLCRLCRVYAKQEKQAQAYYLSQTELQQRIDRIKQHAATEQDSIMLLSGGKDSSYALCKLVDMGLNPLVFTLDNGFISEGAKANIKRLVDRLGLELVVGETPAMNDIFVDSLNRFSNVCNGCFKTIYTLSMNLARQRGIKVICTGLSRGQIFESRVAHLFQQGCFEADKIDQQIIDARKAYHRAKDIIDVRLDTEIFKDESIFTEIEYLDFFRYTDVTLDEMYAYLHNIAPWIRPSDTGRSTNCLINDAGIYVHKKQRGYHNYALPYSWDVRLGHKNREAALDELNDELDQQKVDKILTEIGYYSADKAVPIVSQKKLVAYYVAAAEINKNILQKHLSATLPKEYVPHHYIWLKAMPLTINGKVDRLALPPLKTSRRELAVDYHEPQGSIEQTLAELWARLLGIDEVGREDNFFDLGGDSIVSIQIVAAARVHGIGLSLQQIFDSPTIKELAAVAETIPVVKAEQAMLTGAVPLLPAQLRFFSQFEHGLDHFSQSVYLRCASPIDHHILQQALSAVIAHHDGLRSRFIRNDGSWQQSLLAPEQVKIRIQPAKIPANTEPQDALQKSAQSLNQTLNIERGHLIAVAHLRGDRIQNEYLVIVIHHLVVDGVSWWSLLQDLEQCYQKLFQHQAIELPDKTCSVRKWVQTLQKFADNKQSQQSFEYWQKVVRQANKLSNIARQIPSIQEEKTYTCTLPKDLTDKLIHALPAKFKVQVPEVILTALMRTLMAASNKQGLFVAIESHGREHALGKLDISRTVSWFTSIFPLILRPSDIDSIGEELKTIKNQLHSVSHQSMEYDALRYLSIKERAASLTPSYAPELVFNYMGQWQRMLSNNSQFSFASPIDALYGSNHLQGSSFEVNAMVFDDVLLIHWTYDAKRYNCTEINALGEQLISSISKVIEYCLHTEDNTLTPTDFNVDIEQSDLDDIFAEFGED